MSVQRHDVTMVQQFPAAARHYALQGHGVYHSVSRLRRLLTTFPRSSRLSPVGEQHGDARRDLLPVPQPQPPFEGARLLQR